MDQLSAGQVRRSIQRFHDYATDLIRADLNTFDDRMNVLADFCRADPVFSVIHSQLANNPGANATDWFQKKRSSASQVGGWAVLDFPTEVDQRISLMYQVLLAIQDDTISFREFARMFFRGSSGRWDDYVAAFSNAVVEPLVREINYKLEEIQDNLSKSSNDTVPATVLNIIHTEGHVIQQVAFGRGHTQTATMQVANPELGKAIQDLRREIETAPLGEEEKKGANEIVDTVERELGASTPSKAAVAALLKALPIVGNISSIVSLILSLL